MSGTFMQIIANFFRFAIFITKSFTNKICGAFKFTYSLINLN